MVDFERLAQRANEVMKRRGGPSRSRRMRAS